jgi:purine-binding chemotaxis protein CheW
VPDTKDLRLIAFRTGAETFVIDIMSVRQILPYSGSTFVPTAPSFVEGIMILRNQVIAVIDLRDRLEVDQSLRSKKPLVLITDTSAGTIGLKVDEVKKILNVRSDALLPPPPLIRGIRGELLVAIVHHEKEVFLLIDVESVLSTEEKTELQSAELSVPASEGVSER